MKKITHLLIFSCLLVFFACSSKTSLSEAEKKYFQDMTSAHKGIEVIKKFTSAREFSKPKFDVIIEQNAPTIVKTLNGYKNTEFTNKDSFQALVKSIESYLIAKEMWEQNKGLALVNNRLAEGTSWFNKATDYLDREKNPEKYLKEVQEQQKQ